MQTGREERGGRRSSHAASSEKRTRESCRTRPCVRVCGPACSTALGSPRLTSQNAAFNQAPYSRPARSFHSCFYCSLGRDRVDGQELRRGRVQEQGACAVGVLCPLVWSLYVTHTCLPSYILSTAPLMLVHVVGASHRGCPGEKTRPLVSMLSQHTNFHYRFPALLSSIQDLNSNH